MNTNDEERIFEALLEYLRQSRGFDFTGYKRSSLKRRVRKQMQSRGIDNFGDYLDYLQVHSEEFLSLFNTVLINVTAFFRDKSAWNYLQQEIIPRIIRDKSERGTIRVWSAGCASGQEAYTLAMLLAEALGTEQFRRRVKIYATDVDEEALDLARQASYTAKDLKPVTSELQEKYFEAAGGQYIFRPDLRRTVIFGRHDLIQDAPISRLDLLVCRNTLMYFNAETQAKILNRFHFALNDSGFLFLGKAEMLLTHANVFTPVSLANRIFSRVPGRNRRDRFREMSPMTESEASNNLESYLHLRESAFDAVPIPQLIVDSHGNLVLANAAARTMFGINRLSLGSPLRDLEISYRPLELRSQIERVENERRLIIVRDVVRNLQDEKRQYLDVQFNPLEDNGGEFLGVSISFNDVTRYRQLQEQLQKSHYELETANEEFQSTNEELETTNEELQSTNEELETMNEELQSTNEELQTLNDELHLRTNELNQANALLNSILASLEAGVVVIDRQFKILSWNEEAANLWGLRVDEVKDQSLFSLDIGLPVEQLREPIRNCLATGEKHQSILLSAINRRGKTIQCRINYNPLISSQPEIQGVILLMEAIEQ
jgi:two-component system CheB/CheR fusion protein